MGRHSIKVKATLLLTIIISSLIILILVANSTLSEKFYFSGKEKSMRNLYSQIDAIMTDYSNEKINQSHMNDSVEQIVTTAAVSTIIVDSDWSVVYTNNNAQKDMLNRLMASLFNNDIFKNQNVSPDLEDSKEDIEHDNQEKKKPGTDKIINMAGSGVEENREIVTQTDKYTLQKIYDDRLEDEYYELWGTLSNGNLILFRTGAQGIKNNVAISNKFITYVGLVMLVVGVAASYSMSVFLSKPIMQLSEIAEKMSDMDFNTKYTGKDKGEIGILGRSMNNMSESLEKNILQLKKANIELSRDLKQKAEMESMRSEFLSNVSHELKTPISLIQGYAEGLKEGITDDPESMDFYCDVIIDESKKMNHMVRKLLTLNQLEFGEDDVSIERFNIVELLKAIINAIELRASQENIKINFICDMDCIDVWADEYKTEEVITNYLSNAINHCDNEKIINVTVSHKDNSDVHVAVFNTGKNIPKEDIENIWDKFYKVDKARTREYGGNGIGLSIVKAIMESYGKPYGVRNMKDGVEFWFDLDGKSVL